MKYKEEVMIITVIAKQVTVYSFSVSALSIVSTHVSSTKKAQ